MKRLLIAAMMTAAVTLVPACGAGGGNDYGHGAAEANAFADVSKAVCVLTPTTGTELTGVTGLVTLTQTKDGLLIEAEVTGLKPDSKHGFHIHQWGDITDRETGKAAGDHYNPAGLPHSLPGEGHAHGDVIVHVTGGHAGALGNLETDAEGKAVFSKTFENITLTGKNAVLGRSFVVHIGEDKGADYQPSGDAGPRVAQGVIGIADPAPPEAFIHSAPPR